jgi:hypothetical protein
MATRVIDLLCDYHRDTAQEAWPIGATLADLTASPDYCGDCRDVAATYPPGLRVRVLPQLDATVWTAVGAAHEAGHATAALTLGHPVVDAHIVPVTDRDAPSAGQHDGGVNVAQWTAPLAEHLTIRWAGLAASQRWLREQGHTLTPADLVDLAVFAGYDAADARAMAWQVPNASWREGLREAHSLVREHWDSVTRITTALLRRHRLTGDQLRNLHHPRPPTTTPLSVPPSSAHAGSSTTPTAAGGSSAMSSVEEIRAALAQTDQTSQTVLALVQQGMSDLEGVVAMLNQAAAGSVQPAAGQAVAAYSEAYEHMLGTFQWVSAAMAAAQQYAAVV